MMTETLTEESAADVQLAVPDNNSIATMAETRFRIPGDVIANATRELDEESRTAVKWFAGYLRARNIGPSDGGTVLRKLGSAEFYSWASIYAALTGRRADAGVSVKPLVDAMKAMRVSVEGASRIGDGGFIITRLSKEIEKRCDRARRRKKILFIFGDSQIGKTEALRHYTRTHNHGETIYIEAPTGGSITLLMKEFGEKMHIPACRTQDMRTRVMECFDGKMLLIVDEAHRFLKGGRGMESLDFLRELYNKRGCGIVLSMTNEGRDLLRFGPEAKKLEQLWRRRITPLQTPAMLSRADLALFSESYKLAAADEEPVTIRVEAFDRHTGDAKIEKYSDVPLALQTRVNKEDGLGVWLTILQDATDIAQEQGKRITWGAVLKAYCASKADGEVWA